jgi:thioredoxin 1
MLRLLTGLATGVLLFLLSAGCSQSSDDTATNVSSTPTAPATGVVLGSGRPMLVDLGADECVPCKLMKPILDNITEEYAGRMDVIFIDVWKYREQATRFNVRMIPTQIFFDEQGKELYRRSGFIGKEDILTTWQQLGYTF